MATENIRNQKLVLSAQYTSILKLRNRSSASEIESLLGAHLWGEEGSISSTI